MKHWCTSFTAVDPMSGKLTEYEGPTIQALNFIDAETQCRIKYPYACVVGQIVIKANYDEKTGKVTNLIDYEGLKNN